jgi:hypothetical protein
MKHLLRTALLAAILAVLNIAHSSAAIFTKDTGDWPKDWPAELEPLRGSARTIGIATGIQQDVYEVTFGDRETFEKIWPVLLKVRTPGSLITLYRHQTSPPKMWGELLSNAKPAVRIFAPSGGFSLKEEVDPQKPFDAEALIREGRALRAGPPWPDYLLGKSSELPEFVVSEKNDEGKLVWIPADPSDPAKQRLGFFNRARVELELVIDGQVIDLNRIALPEDAALRDRRFDEAP